MLIPYLTLQDPRAAMTLYERALDALTEMVMDGPDGSVMHAEMSVGEQRLMLSGVWPGMSRAPEGRSPVNFMLYVDDVDASLERAEAAGMRVVSEPENMFWGDRTAKAADGHGYEWTFARQVESVSDEELARRAAAFAASMGDGG